jgi:AcrR family transcriptional regulator
MVGKSTEGARPSTRTRILAACRELFNERGPADVTTAQIAAAVGINEGNLYYHFNRKEQILEALFEEFERALQLTASPEALTGEDPARHSRYFSGWFTLMWEWRFFYRDGGLVYRLAPALRSRLKTLSDKGQQQLRRALDYQVEAGLIKLTPEEMDRVIVNAWIVASYWIDYLRSRHGLAEITREHVGWGAMQVMSLYLPYLTPAGHALWTIQTEGVSQPAL